MEPSSVRSFECHCTYVLNDEARVVFRRDGAGDCERLGDKLAGIAVHTGARVAALAGPGETLVSSPDLLA